MRIEITDNVALEIDRPGDVPVSIEVTHYDETPDLVDNHPVSSQGLDKRDCLVLAQWLLHAVNYKEADDEK